MDHRIGCRVLARFDLGCGDNIGKLAGFDLVGLGQDQPVTDRRFVEHLEHLAVNVFDPVAAVDQHQRAFQHLPSAQEIADQAAPVLNHLERGLGIAIARHIDQPQLGRFAHFKEVQLLRAPRRDRGAGDRFAARHRIEQRALADVGTSGKGDFRHLGIGQELERRRALQKLHAARKQLASGFGQIGFVIHRITCPGPWLADDRPHPFPPAPLAAGVWNRGRPAGRWSARSR